MATLQAIVDIQDRASAKFARMTAAAKAFEEQLDKVDRKLKEVEAKMAAMSRMKVTMRASLDTSNFDAQLAAMMARARAAGISDISIGANGPDTGGLGGFAMTASGLAVPDSIARVISGDGDPETGIRGVDRSRRRRVGIERANNGVLGFVTTVFRLLLNLRTILGPLTDGFAKLFDIGTEFVGGVLTKLGLNGAKFIGTMSELVPLLASVAAGFTALGAAAFAVVMIGTALAGVLGLIATALTSLLVPLAALTAGIGGLIGIVGFVAIPMIKWISDTKKLVDEKDELNKKLETLDKTSKEYIKTQNRLNEIQKELNKSGAEGVFRQLQSAGDRIGNAIFTPKNTQLFTDIIAKGLEALRPLLPILTKLVTMFATEIAKVADKFVEFTKDPANLALIMNFFEAGARLIQPFADVVGQLGKLFMQLGVAIGPIAEVMLRDLAGWLKSITDYLSTPEGMASLRKFFEDMYPVFKDLVVLLVAFLGGIKDVGVALAPEFRMVIGWLREVGGQFVKWIIETVKKYGPDFARFMRIIGNVIGIIWDILTKVYDAAQPVIQVIFSIIEGILNWARVLLRLIEVSHVIDVIRIALTIVLTPVRWLVNGIKLIFEKMNELLTWVANSTFGQVIAAAFEAIATVVEAVAGAVDKLISGIKWLLEHLPSFSKNFSPDQIAAYRNSVMGGGIGGSPGAGNAAGTMTGGQIPTSPNVEGGGASGAIVTRPTRALIGEAGPEAVVPLHATRGSRRLQLGSESGVQISGDIHVHGVQNLNDFVNEVQKYISNLPRESGSEMSIG